ncbi:unnamed protein product [Vicia faba]|uniref:DRBM domain-containing protein n=1 Tax=Vicia faba TaxID=3906 RepID=A0AAV0ZKU1_VICFA|nr:unnamed protein product [Vicia faba]
MTKTAYLMRKAQLQSYAQKNNLDQPVFTFKVEGLPHVIFYKATVVIGGKSFDNPTFFNTRKEAEHATRFNFFSGEQLRKHSVHESVCREDIKGRDHNEAEAIQRLNLHKASTIGNHLLWPVERMIELRVADADVREHSEQEALKDDLKRAFHDDSLRNIVSGLSVVIPHCTSKLSHVVCADTILASTQVRRKLVEDWLPILVVCKYRVSLAIETT